MHATIKPELDPKKAYPEDTEPPRHTAKLSIWRTTSLSTITSLLSHPLDWAFADGETSRSPVLGIASAIVYYPARFDVGERPAKGFFEPISAGLQCVHVSKCTLDGASDPEQLATSVRTLSQFSLGDISRTPGKSRLDIQCNDPEDAQAWLLGVSQREAYTNDPILMMISFRLGSIVAPTFNLLSVYTSGMNSHGKISWTGLMPSSTSTRSC